MITYPIEDDGLVAAPDLDLVGLYLRDIDDSRQREAHRMARPHAEPHDEVLPHRHPHLTAAEVRRGVDDEGISCARYSTAAQCGNTTETVTAIWND